MEREQALAEKNSMEFISFPVIDRGLPKSVFEFCKFVKRLHLDILNGKNTVIHCRAGIGRTGMVTAGILFHAGIKPEEVFTFISQKRGVPVPDTQEQKSWIISNYTNITNAQL